MSHQKKKPHTHSASDQHMEKVDFAFYVLMATLLIATLSFAFFLTPST